MKDPSVIAFNITINIDQELVHEKNVQVYSII